MTPTEETNTPTKGPEERVEDNEIRVESLSYLEIINHLQHGIEG